MSTSKPLVATDRLDHVHLYVTDRPAAVEWYNRVLGLVPYGRWRNEDPAPDHPVFLAAKGQPHSVSLFTGPRPEGGDRTVAFHASGPAFIVFAEALPVDLVLDRDREVPLRPSHHHDFGEAITFNFLDPAGNHLELVTYDAADVRAALKGMS